MASLLLVLQRPSIADPACPGPLLRTFLASHIGHPCEDYNPNPDIDISDELEDFPDEGASEPAKDSNASDKWSAEKCESLASQIARLRTAVGRNSNTIIELASSNPGAGNYVLNSLSNAKLVNNIYKLGMASTEFRQYINSSRLAVGVQGVSTGIGAFGLVANFYGLTRGIENEDTGEIVSSAAAISLWGILAIGGSEGSAIIVAMNPWVAAGALGTAGALIGYEAYLDIKTDRAIAQTIAQNIGYLNQNIENLAKNESLHSAHCQ